ncbi:hypothetical protein ACP275_03G119400 [Erythranthe tilingii]
MGNHVLTIILYCSFAICRESLLASPSLSTSLFHICLCKKSNQHLQIKVDVNQFITVYPADVYVYDPSV